MLPLYQWKEVSVTTDYIALRKQYPPAISADQFRQICHISKRKAKWLLENGVVPCHDSGKKTRRFTIQLDDVIRYLWAKENAPTTVSTPQRLFSSVGAHTNADNQRVCIPPDKLRSHLERLWQKQPDALTITDITKLIGYSTATIGHWIEIEKLQAVWYYNHYKIPKSALVDCLITLESDQRFQRSPRYLEIINKIANESCQHNRL